MLIDRAALAAVETSDRVEASLTAKKQPLGAALCELLRPLGLSYLAVGPQTIQVTSKEAADERLELEFYPVGEGIAGPAKKDPLLPVREGQQRLSPLPLGEGQGVRVAALAEQLRTRVAASTWSNVGGPGEVYFDPPSQCLIVLQSQPAQAAVQQFLADSLQPKRERRAKKDE